MRERRAEAAEAVCWVVEAAVYGTEDSGGAGEVGGDRDTSTRVAGTGLAGWWWWWWSVAVGGRGDCCDDSGAGDDVGAGDSDDCGERL